MRKYKYRHLVCKKFCHKMPENDGKRTKIRRQPITKVGTAPQFAPHPAAEWGLHTCHPCHIDDISTTRSQHAQTSSDTLISKILLHWPVTTQFHTAMKHSHVCWSLGGFSPCLAARWAVISRNKASTPG